MAAKSETPSKIKTRTERGIFMSRNLRVPCRWWNYTVLLLSGIRHSARSKSISDQHAARSSTVRTKVSNIKRNAMTVVRYPPYSSRALMKCGMSDRDSGLLCFTRGRLMAPFNAAVGSLSAFKVEIAYLKIAEQICLRAHPATSCSSPRHRHHRSAGWPSPPQPPRCSPCAAKPAPCSGSRRRSREAGE